MAHSLSVLFIWFDYKGNRSVCGSLFLSSRPLCTLRSRPREAVFPSLASSWLIYAIIKHRKFLWGLRQFPGGWLKCRCKTSTSAQTGTVAGKAHDWSLSFLLTRAPFSGTSLYTNYKSLSPFLYSTIPSDTEKLRWVTRCLSILPAYSLRWFPCTSKSVHGFGDCWFFSLWFFTLLCPLQPCENSEYVSALWIPSLFCASSYLHFFSEEHPSCKALLPLWLENTRVVDRGREWPCVLHSLTIFQTTVKINRQHIAETK